jgi:hypothetical protein
MRNIRRVSGRARRQAVVDKRREPPIADGPPETKTRHDVLSGRRADDRDPTTTDRSRSVTTPNSPRHSTTSPAKPQSADGMSNPSRPALLHQRSPHSPLTPARTTRPTPACRTTAPPLPAAVVPQRRPSHKERGPLGGNTAAPRKRSLGAPHNYGPYQRSVEDEGGAPCHQAACGKIAGAPSASR